MGPWGEVVDVGTVGTLACEAAKGSEEALRCNLLGEANSKQMHYRIIEPFGNPEISLSTLASAGPSPIRPIATGHVCPLWRPWSHC